MSKTAWIVFRSCEHWLQRYLKDGFGHISILYRDDFNWLLLSPNAGILETIILPYTVEQNAPQWLANGKDFTVLRVDYLAKNESRWFPRFMPGLTCVSFTKYFLGYKDFSLTPYQLYKNLQYSPKNIMGFEELK